MVTTQDVIETAIALGYTYVDLGGELPVLSNYPADNWQAYGGQAHHGQGHCRESRPRRPAQEAAQ
jgi:hypothetical protein